MRTSVRFGLALLVFSCLAACSGSAPASSTLTLDGLPPVTLAEGESKSIPLHATSPGGAALQFTLVSPPAFATVTGATLQLAPGYSDAGSYTLTVRVSNGTHTADGALSLTVTNVNRPPVMKAIPDVSVAAGTTSEVTLDATDPDEDPVTFSLDEAPTFAALSGSVLTLSPDASAVGEHDVSVSASDGSASAGQTLHVTVTPPNAPPSITSMDQVDAANAPVPQNALVPSAPRLQVAFTDSNGDAVQVEAEVVLASATFTGAVTHHAAGSVTSPQIVDLGTLAPGDYKWRVRAKDAAGGTSAWQVFQDGATAFTVFPSLTGPAVPFGGKPLHATNATGSMTLYANHADGKTGCAVDMAWAFWNGQAWSGGSLGPGRCEGGKLIAWGDKFVAEWPYGEGFRWAIFQDGAWSIPDAAPPRGDIAANALGVMQTWLTTVSYFDPGYGFYTTDYQIDAQLFDGTTWGPVMIVAGATHPALISNANPKIAASADDFAVLYEPFHSAGYDDTQYTSTAVRYANGTWSSGPSLSMPGYSLLLGTIVGSDDGFAFSSPQTGVYTYNAGTGVWTPSGVNANAALVTDGHGFAAASSNGELAVFADGAWTQVSTLAGSPEVLVGEAGQYIAVHRDTTTATLSTRVYEAGAWSAPTSTPAASAASQLAGYDATFAGGDVAIAYIADGSANVLLRTSGGWQVKSALQSDAETSGGVAVVNTGGSVTALFGNGTNYVARPWTGTSFGPPAQVSTTHLTTDCRNPQIAFLPNGRGLATWEQNDLGVYKVFAAEFDGTQWMPGARVSNLSAESSRVTHNGAQFEILFGSRPDAGGYGLYAVPFVPGSGAGAATELLSPASNNDGLGGNLASDGTGFLATFRQRSSDATQSRAMYSTSQDGVIWSAPAVLEPTVTSSLGIPSVVGNGLGYLIAIPVSDSQWNVRFFTGGTLGAATSYSNEVALVANPSAFALAENDSPNTQMRIYSEGAWSAPVSFSNTSSPWKYVGSDTGFRAAWGNKTAVWDGSSWSGAQTIGPYTTVDALASLGSGYGAINIPYQGSPIAYRSNGANLETVPIPSLPNPRSPPLALGAGAAAYWLLLLAANAPYASNVVALGSF